VAGDAFFRNGHIDFDWRRTASIIAHLSLRRAFWEAVVCDWEFIEKRVKEVIDSVVNEAGREEGDNVYYIHCRTFGGMSVV
jgi:hypothetical protein